MAARPIWKGNISFGIVNIPVSLIKATRGDDLRMAWNARRCLARRAVPATDAPRPALPVPVRGE